MVLPSRAAGEWRLHFLHFEESRRQSWTASVASQRDVAIGYRQASQQTPTRESVSHEIRIGIPTDV
jgi:hypothetical protein